MHPTKYVTDCNVGVGVSASVGISASASVGINASAC